MQFAPTQIASSPRTAGRSSRRRRAETASRQLALFGEGTRTLPLGSALPVPVGQQVPAAQPIPSAQKAPSGKPANPKPVHSGKRLVLDTTPAVARGVTCTPQGSGLPVQALRVLPVGATAAVISVPAAAFPVPEAGFSVPTAAFPVPAAGDARTLSVEDELWQPMSRVQKLLEIGGAGLLMVACVALAIFW